MDTIYNSIVDVAKKFHKKHMRKEDGKSMYTCVNNCCNELIQVLFKQSTIPQKKCKMIVTDDIFVCENHQNEIYCSHVQITKFIQKNGCMDISKINSTIEKNIDRNVVLFDLIMSTILTCMKTDRFENTKEIISLFVRYNCYNSIQFIMDLNYECDENIVSLSAKYGNIDILQYLISKNCIFTNDAMKIAVENGHTECVKYLYHCHFDMDIYALCIIAIENNSFDIFKFLVESEYYYNDRIIKYIIKYDRIKFFILLYNQEYIVNDTTYMYALKYKSSYCLKFLRDRGFE